VANFLGDGRGKMKDGSGGREGERGEEKRRGEEGGSLSFSTLGRKKKTRRV